MLGEEEAPGGRMSWDILRDRIGYSGFKIR